jgi:hypothetical protein
VVLPVLLLVSGVVSGAGVALLSVVLSVEVVGEAVLLPPLLALVSLLGIVAEDVLLPVVLPSGVACPPLSGSTGQRPFASGVEPSGHICSVDVGGVDAVGSFGGAMVSFVGGVEVLSVLPAPLLLSLPPPLSLLPLLLLPSSFFDANAKFRLLSIKKTKADNDVKSVVTRNTKTILFLLIADLE